VNIEIRNIASADAPEIARLSGQLGYPLNEEQARENIMAVMGKEDHRAFVAIDNDKVVGWIHVFVTTQLESASFSEIRGLVIDESHRRKGIGKLLIEQVKSWSRQKQRNLLRLRCNVKRTETHKFYAALGFSEMKEQKVLEIKL
jgi:GNAT superfamily N-acetyltransferase